MVHPCHQSATILCPHRAHEAMSRRPRHNQKWMNSSPPMRHRVTKKIILSADDADFSNLDP
jgi:hypothetical protein